MGLPHTASVQQRLMMAAEIFASKEESSMV
jgi:hypothetical protein